ncbi:YbaN family protein [Pseudomonas petrae]|uniref:YbaN family protein n=1 Tax=Pseudomonas petrae TaxID=2912190 RepID=A0ABS9I268_9PSED|nr:YbaN family protein [Pseudomonas petrae]MCF7533240.1 YbaN family protein [Pseudomonas petrae]MCF7538514.1 YbaN family protein [Pseudomonas petrae]MCF7541451.1 YbaN family protein [Pseudomonas petrae]MCF7556131.1 YbaN family protein [Pseudomonas petrae]
MTSTPPGSKLSRILFGILAYVSLTIGIIAIFIPGLPTTEFILLAAWAATRSSPRLSAWLENHRLFGPMLSNWRNGKMIARKAKISATVTMLICAVMMLVLLKHNWWIYFAVAGMVLVNLWIWSRPEPSRLSPAQPLSPSPNRNDTPGH